MSQIDPPTIADTELRLAMLRRLASLGMLLAEEVCERAINSPYHPEPRHEPARAFATVSRAVRLTLVLQARVEADLLALRNGETIMAEPAPRLRETATEEAADDDLPDDDALETPDPARENLCERERFDEILARPFDECVAAIRADFGLSPGDDIPPCSADVVSATFSAPQADDTPALQVAEQDPPDTG